MVSKLIKEHDRRTLLATYLYGVSNLFISGTGIGGFSPLITGDEIGLYNYHVNATERKFRGKSGKEHKNTPAVKKSSRWGNKWRPL